ncbi:NUDIX hydrolase [Shimazuella kribbensis]|uniref:NUDIX hydrolase n=1 Tax=Shimazuella kribbensis TaxID=139808 RepID=UPI00040E6B6D|nr:NUDIX hydrolase [Shimazuella kribbensis]
MIISVCAYVENDLGEVLLVKTHLRSDTWEFPGGNVEEHESIHTAVHREVREETGVLIKPLGVTGVYQNLEMNVLCIVFRAKYVSGEIIKQENEIREACFVKLNEKNVSEYITRPNLQSRYFDAVNSNLSSEVWQNSSQLLTSWE